MDGPVVLYDGDCGFCRWAIERLRAWDRNSILTFRPLQGSEADQLLGGMDLETRLSSWHLVEPDGRVWSAGAAVPRVLGSLPAGKPFAALARLAPTATDRAYRLVMTHRQRLGAVLGQRACAVDPSRGGHAPRP